jgi:hypothetical protein
MDERIGDGGDQSIGHASGKDDHVGTIDDLECDTVIP